MQNKHPLLNTPRMARPAWSRYSLAGWVVLLIVAPLLLAASSRRIERVSIRDNSGAELMAYGESHALLIGVSRYTNGWPSLTSIPREVADIEDVLLEHGFDVRVVMDPSSHELQGAFRDFINDYGYEPSNRLFFFFSGHGHTRDDGRKGYLVPGEAPDPRRDERGFLRKALPMTQIVAWAKAIEVRHALFVFDSCFSGTIFKTKSLPTHPPHINHHLGKPVRQFISAGGAGEEVPAKSVFSPALVEALRGSADLNADGYIVGTELGMYIRDSVLRYDIGQMPQFGKIKDPDLDGGDYVFQVPRPLLAAAEVAAPPSTSPQLELPQVGRLNQIRTEWAEYQAKMDEAYEDVFDFDESPYVLGNKKAEAWRRFLGAFAEDNPFSDQDDHFRRIALRRLTQLEAPPPKNAEPEVNPTLPVPLESPTTASDPKDYVVFIDDQPDEARDARPVLHFETGHHLGTLYFDSEIRPCAATRHPLRAWAARQQQACWELLPYVEDVEGGRSYFYSFGGGYYPRPVERVIARDDQLLRFYAFTPNGERLTEVSAYRLTQCIEEMNESWAAVQTEGCMVMASDQRYREAQLCGDRQELCVFFGKSY